MEIIEIVSSCQNIADFQRVQPVETAFIRVHGEQAASGEGVVKVNSAVIFTEQTVIVQVAGCVAHGTGGIRGKSLGKCHKDYHNDQKKGNNYG